MQKDDALKLLTEHKLKLIGRFGIYIHWEDLTVKSHNHIL